MHSRHFTPNDPNFPLAVLPLHHLHALPGPPGPAPPRRGLPCHGLRQHHRLLPPLGPRHGHGAHLRPGLRRQEIQTARPHHAQNCSPPSRNFHSHFLLVAKHAHHLSLFRSRTRNRKRGSSLHLLFSP
ncbi:uncharacterized protein DS421_11g333930 [Arachis hypogaea]|nr:uncharacterized protein DS421_11g333930 [Arachis hypogaea]